MPTHTSHHSRGTAPGSVDSVARLEFGGQPSSVTGIEPRGFVTANLHTDAAGD